MTALNIGGMFWRGHSAYQPVKLLMEKTMGLDTSHDCWHGPYSAFMRWRTAVAKAAGMPPLSLMEGFYTDDATSNPLVRLLSNESRELDSRTRELKDSLPIRWDCLKPDPLIDLLDHSDCDGTIESSKCAAIADRLVAIMPELPKGIEFGSIGDYRDKTIAFIDGLRLAASKGESVDFH